MNHIDNRKGTELSLESLIQERDIKHLKTKPYATVLYVLHSGIFRYRTERVLTLRVYNRRLDPLRRLEPVSTLPSDALIRRKGTTTLYRELAILWYQMKHELLLNKIQSLLWRNMSTWQRASPVKTPFILSLVAYISKATLVTPIFYF